MSDQMERTEMETVHPERGGEDYSADRRAVMASALAKQHRVVSASHGDRWPEVVASHRGVIAEAMEIRGTVNPMTAAVALAAEMLRRGKNPEIIMAVAVEIAKELRERHSNG